MNKVNESSISPLTEYVSFSSSGKSSDGSSPSSDSTIDNERGPRQAVIQPRGLHVAQRLREFTPLVQSTSLSSSDNRQCMCPRVTYSTLENKWPSMLEQKIHRRGMRLLLLTGINLHMNLRCEDFKLDSDEPEALSCVHILQEAWDGKHELLVGGNVEPLDARSGYPTNVFRIRYSP